MSRYFNRKDVVEILTKRHKHLVDRIGIHPEYGYDVQERDALSIALEIIDQCADSRYKIAVDQVLLKANGL